MTEDWEVSLRSRTGCFPISHTPEGSRSSIKSGRWQRFSEFPFHAFGLSEQVRAAVDFKNSHKSLPSHQEVQSLPLLETGVTILWPIGY